MTRRALLAVVLVAAGFFWGLLVHRNHVFPYLLIRQVTWKLKLFEQPRLSLTPRTRRSSQETARDRLDALGYLQTTLVDSDEEQTGVVLIDRKKSSPGLNLYKEIGTREAYLIDQDGLEVHTWRFDPGDSVQWIHAELLPDNGAIIGIGKDESVFRLSVDSKLEWRTHVRAHHDLQVRPDGTIWALTRRHAKWPERYGDRTILEDCITILSPEGEVVDEFSLLEAFRGSPYEYLMPEVADFDPRFSFDIQHANHIEVFDGVLADQSPLFSEGNLLVSFRTINTIAILDGKTREVLWLWGPTNLAVQHHPRLLDNGHILVFDNGFEESRVLEIELPQGKIAWEYVEGPEFHSSWGGAVQRLPNGNTLITNTHYGEVFETTPAGEIVWRFINPRVDDGSTLPTPTGLNGRWNIWRMTRYDEAELPFLN